MGIDDGDDGGHRDHRLDRIAALGEDVASRLGGERMRGGDGGMGKYGFVGQIGLPSGGETFRRFIGDLEADR